MDKKKIGHSCRHWHKDDFSSFRTQVFFLCNCAIGFCYSIVKDSNVDLTLKLQNPPIIMNEPGIENVCFSLNIKNRKNDTPLFSLGSIKILSNNKNTLKF